MRPAFMSRSLWRSFRREFVRRPFGALTILLRKARLSKNLSQLEYGREGRLRYTQYSILVLNQDMSAFNFSYMPEGHDGTPFRHKLVHYQAPEARA